MSYAPWKKDVYDTGQLHKKSINNVDSTNFQSINIGIVEVLTNVIKNFKVFCKCTLPCTWIVLYKLANPIELKKTLKEDQN